MGIVKGLSSNLFKFIKGHDVGDSVFRSNYSNLIENRPFIEITIFTAVNPYRESYEQLLPLGLPTFLPLAP